MSERELFLAAARIDDPAERAAFLDQACVGGAAQRGRLEALLKAHGGGADVLEERLADVARLGRLVDASILEDTPLMETEPDDQAGRTIGDRFVLRELLGVGGMGSVWLAEQTQPVRRRVAVKLLRSG